MGSAAVVGSWVSVLSMVSGVALAQTPPSSQGAPKPGETITTVTTTTSTTPAAALPPAPPPAPLASDAVSPSPAPPPTTVMGSTYSDHPKTTLTDSPRPMRRGPVVHPMPRSALRSKVSLAPDAPIATFPGFETLPDGGTRVFVQVSKNVTVEEQKGASSITYVLKGARVLKRNNTNPLVTVHINTPVASARLVPAGSNLDFVVALRASSTPAWRVAQAAEGGSRLEIDFPKGTFVNAAAEATPIAKGDAANNDVSPDAESAVPKEPASSPQAAAAVQRKTPMRLTAPPPKTRP